MKPVDRTFRQLAFAQVLLGLAAFCLADNNTMLLGVAGAFAMSAYLVTEGPHGRGLNRTLLNLGAMAAVLFTLGEALITQAARPIVLIGHFTLTLQIVLLFARKTRREYIQLAILSPLQMISASVLPGGFTLVYALMLFLYCFLALLTAISFQLKSTSDLVAQRHRRGIGDQDDHPFNEPSFGPRYRLHLRLSAWAIGLCCLLIAALVFVATPRSQQDRFAATLVNNPNAASPQRVGFNSRVELTGGSIANSSEQPVLNIRLSENRPAISDRPWLIRGAVQDQYDPQSTSWSRSAIHEAYDLVLEVPDRGLRLARDSRDVHDATITLRRKSLRNLFTVASEGGPVAPVFLDAPGLERVAFSPEDQQLESGDALAAVLRYELRWRNAPYTDLRPDYRERFQPHAQQPIGDRTDGYANVDEGTGHRSPLLIETPASLVWSVETDRVRALAEQVLRLRELPTDYTSATAEERMAAARALAQYLRRGYRYTLDNPRATGADPVIGFLFTTRAGHCELFASGLAALCRSVGIPARLATGYHASEYNSIGGYYVVRESHAHAWTEVDLGPGAGWHALDATPPGEVEDNTAAGSGYLRQARELYDHLEFNWIAAVITFDKHAQQRLLGSLGDLLSRGPDQWAAGIQAWLADRIEAIALDDLNKLLILFIAIALLIAVFSLVRLLVLRHRRMVALQLTALPRAQQRTLARQLRFYIHMLELLERYGRARPHWQSPFQFAQALIAESPDQLEPVLPLTELFYEVRFGYRSLDRTRQASVREQLRQLEQNLVRLGRA